VKVRLTLLAGASLAGLVPVAQGAGGPQTTAPPPLVNIKVRITDTAIRMIPARAQRGVMARFIVVNSGTKKHTFKLGRGAPAGFAVRLKARQQSVKIYFLDVRGKVPYLGSDKADLKKRAMRGTFTIF
jgi:hypothetical protein